MVIRRPFYRSVARRPANGRCYPYPMADVRPFRGLRYAPGLDLSAAICPPFDIISPDQQRALHERSPYNAVHVELAYDSNGSRYERASESLLRWRQDGTLVRDETPAFYLYDQQFERDGVPYRRRLVFARLRLETWDKGIVLPRERVDRQRARELRACRPRLVRRPRAPRPAHPSRGCGGRPAVGGARPNGGPVRRRGATLS